MISVVHIYWNGPEGISEGRKCILRSNAADHLTVADFNRDGWLDIFVGNYHNEKERDIDSFICWNHNGKFSEFDCQLLPTHSASGCMAADFNEDGYIDLAIANHKINRDHVGCSTVWWNGPTGFNTNHITELPTEGPHGMISAEIGNIIDRSMSEYYYSECYTVGSKCMAITDAYAIGDIPPQTSVNILIRKNGGNWQVPKDIPVTEGDIIEYRAELYAFNCLRTPRIERIVIEME